VNVSAAFVREVGERLQARDVIASGYLEPEPPELSGFRHRDRRVQNGWAADLFRSEG